ncbi:MAG: ATP-dependent DNA helicase RecG [Burkholderiaceae bacterium]
MPKKSAAASAADRAAAPAATAALTGPQRALRRLGLLRPIDLALHLPLRYEDETAITPIRQARPGDKVQVEGTVTESHVDARGRRQFVVSMTDASGGELVLRFLNFYPSHLKAFVPGQLVRVHGEIRGGFLAREMVHPAFKPIVPGAPLPPSLTPVYPTTAQLPQPYLRKAIAASLARAPIGEVLPPRVVPADLPPLREALETLHHPPAGVRLPALEDGSHPAAQRLKFEELLAQQLSQLAARAERDLLRAPAIQAQAGGLHEKLTAALPFALTGAQRRVVGAIGADLAGPRPMHRLLQGDVGAGKTVVAALAAAVAIDAGWQCALMAPTEILAEQHFAKLVQWLEPLGIEVAWLSGSRKGKGRARAIERIAGGAAKLVVGTHAVIQHDVAFARLGLAIVDEQHRFGVQQRLALRRKLGLGGLEPHLMMMTATPIPRTLAMTYFADLDVSTLDESPPGRTPVVTRVFADARRPDVVERIRGEIAAGRQVYWVCPLIEESEDAEDAVAGHAGRAEPLTLRNVTDTHAALSDALAGCPVGLLHGRMKAADKAAEMARFKAGATPVLVATTVIEVGVDVPNASLMVIEHAERFGLAQLHQLRGRVGRGSAASVCVLLYAGPLSQTAKDRLKAMAETTDGFEIARRDLEIRGPGEFMGARQSGDQLLRFADLQEDAPLLAHVRRVAPELLAHAPGAASAHVERWFGDKPDWLKA